MSFLNVLTLNFQTMVRSMSLDPLLILTSRELMYVSNYFMSNVNDKRCSQSCSWHSCFSEIKHLASTFEILIIFLRGVCNIVASDWAIELFWSEKS